MITTKCKLSFKMKSSLLYYITVIRIRTDVIIIANYYLFSGLGVV